jgi:zinc dependent phospholipase C
MPLGRLAESVRVAGCLVFFFLLFPQFGQSYSVLTHEQIIDLLWKDQLQPLLLKRFPQSTEDDLRKAHAYAYGGCVIQDMGYYPFGSHYFSDLVHYTRTGDFVEALLHDSGDLNEYAFALGALAHYASDNSGHPTINRVVAIEFPKLRRKYGDQVTYAEDPKAHIRTEFGFDMVQVARNRYTSDRYHDFIGFEVSKPLLERAFLETYDLKLSDVFGDVDVAIGSYRRGVSKVIPEMTRVALLSRKDQLVKETPNFDRKKFVYYLSRTGFNREWGTKYRQPGLGTRILAFFLKLIPKIGPFKAVGFKIPTPQTEDMYIKSINQTVESYAAMLRDVPKSDFQLPNLDFDTGHESKAGEYSLADKTYAHLLDDLSKDDFSKVTPEVRADILKFYGDGSAAVATKKDKKEWKKLQDELEKLRAHSPVEQPPIAPAAN